MATIDFKNFERIKNYYQKGFSVREIAEKIKAPLNATFYFFRKYKIPRRSFKENNAIQFAKKPLSFKLKNRLTFGEERLKNAALMLYWGEGAKRGHTVDFANSDAAMIKIFLKFLRQICGINEKRLRIYTYCYSNQNVKKILKFWSAITKVPLSQFSKPYVRTDYSIKRGRQMDYGMIHVRYSDKKLKDYISAEIEKYKKEFTN